MAERKRILLIEDDPDQASLFQNVLALVGYEVRTAEDAETAIPMLGESAFDLVLVDCDLPGMKGDAFICLVKTQFPGVCTLLYSNHANIEQTAIACGADGWIRKTDDIFRLRALVAALLTACPARV